VTEHRCETCVYWDQAGAKLANAIIDPAAQPDVGVCLFAPPVLMATIHFPVSVFPEVHASRWCGAWDPIPDDGGGGERQPDAKPDNVISFDRSAA